jgi:hypothetical protein
MPINKATAIMLLALIVYSVTVQAIDLELSDGRVLKNAKLVSPSDVDIAVIHSEGVENIPLSLLPEELRAEYEAKTASVVRPEVTDKPKLTEAHRSLGLKNIGNVSNANEAFDAVVLVNTYDDSGNFLGHGTGFYVGEAGHVITNVHVVDGESAVEIVERDGDSFTINTCLFAIPCRDFAVLKVETKPEYFFKVSEVPAIDDKVVVIGHPLEKRWFYTEGVVEKAHDFGYQLHHTLSAEIQPGNSGGPVINESFEVVGQAQYIVTRTVTFSDGVWVYSIKSEDYRSKCIDFGGDRRWSIWDSSFEELAAFNANYKTLEAYLLLLSNLYDVYEVTLDAGESISYVRDVEYNHKHMGLDGRPLTSRDLLIVDWSSSREVENFSKGAIEYFDELLKSSEEDSAIIGLLVKSKSAFNLINRGVNQINRAHGQSYRRGREVFTSGRGIIRQSKNSMRDLIWECRSLIETYGPPNSWNEETYRSFVRTSDLIEEKTGKTLVD